MCGELLISVENQFATHTAAQSLSASNFHFSTIVPHHGFHGSPSRVDAGAPFTAGGRATGAGVTGIGVAGESPKRWSSERINSAAFGSEEVPRRLRT